MIPNMESQKGRISQPTKWERVYNELKRRFWANLLSSETRRKIIGNGIFYNYDELWMASLLPEKCLDLICHEWHPKTLLDIGCGTGVALGYFRSRGIESWGVEGAELAIRMSKVKEFIIEHDLRTPLDLGKKFDLVYCFEVIEHIPPRSEAVFLSSLTRHANRVVMSAAPPGQKGEGHLNMHTQEYWIERFRSRGWNLNVKSTNHLRASDMEPLVQNIMVFESGSLTS